MWRTEYRDLGVEPRGELAPGMLIRLRQGLARQFIQPPRPAPSVVSQRAAVVVPMSTRDELLPEEQISLLHLRRHLDNYDKYLVAPRRSDVEFPGFKTLKFAPRFFGSVAAHNHLLMWRPFYESFQDYTYILIYHLDSLVFADHLQYWCEQGWDYIGAPWLPCDATPWVQEARVGNGGFTLMNVQSAINVLYERHRQNPDTVWADIVTSRSAKLAPVFKVMERISAAFPAWSSLARVVNYWRATQQPSFYGSNSDWFWSTESTRYLPSFRVASVQDGLRFAFEAAPRTCYEMNGRQLPFGCHAWMKFDPEFWKPYLLH